MSGGVHEVTDVGQGKGLEFGVSPLGDLDCGEKEVCSLISGLGCYILGRHVQLKIKFTQIPTIYPSPFLYPKNSGGAYTQYFGCKLLHQ